MLGAHPAVATPQETHLFDQLVRPVHNHWQQHLSRIRSGSPRRALGLPTILTEAEFEDWLGNAIGQIYSKVLDLKPGTTVVLDKTPAHGRHVPLIDKYVPNARFVHLIRDGRDVVVSLREASRGWGVRWAPDTIEEAAEMWRNDVRSARRAISRGSNYLEIRYEDLLAGTPGELRRCFDHLGIDATDELCRRVARRFRPEVMRSFESAVTHDSIVWGGEAARAEGIREPVGFTGPATAGRWKALMSPYDLWVFDEFAGRLLVDLGYEPDRNWVRTSRARAAVYKLRRRMRQNGGRRVTQAARTRARKRPRRRVS